MNWQKDDELRFEMKKRSVRSRIVRSALVWTPLFLACLGGGLYYVVDTLAGGDHGGTWVLVVILGILTLLFGFQSFQSLLDLRAEPHVDTGFVVRRWSRSDSFVMKSHYIRLEKRILRGDVDLLDGIKEDDYVQVRFYPNSAVLVWVEKLAPPSTADGEGVAPG
jgi:hypothetical protein